MQDDTAPDRGQSDKPGQPFDPSTPAADKRDRDADKDVQSPRVVPLGVPMADDEYARLKEDAARGRPPRQRRVQEDP